MTRILKRTLDIIGALIGITILSPLLLAIALWIWLDSGRPLFFAQQRLGKDGRLFWMYKFRSMVINAESMDEGLFSYTDDKRITLPGKYIRFVSLDEMPQLINVIKGDMSLVGPRPPVSYELGNYEDFDARLKGRFVVNPGITGLAQVSGRNALSWDQKIEYDLQYIERVKKYGILEDFRILLLTVGVVASMKNTIEGRPLKDGHES
jgi:lipopolysaccharide/colanic/teichoic acid biosynthesis glycosyltransferase